MNEREQKRAAQEFAERWESKGYEKGESQKFWIDLLEHVYGVDNIAEFISFEDQVHLDHTSFIDGYIESTHVMIEQKSLGKDLRAEIKQSDGTFLTPFKQAKRYAGELSYSKRPRWIVTCNFEEFLVYDMENPQGEPEQILLKDLPREYYRLQFLCEQGNEHIRREMEVSLQAGELVGKLYDAILRQYDDPESPDTLRSLNKLCVRLVFCLYAEDAGVFDKRDMFGNYLKQYPINGVRDALIRLFEVLNTPISERDRYMNDDLAAFPYVNGGLFAEKNIEIPRFTEGIVELLINEASDGFDWSDISPTIFGAVFESTLNPETRRSGGMHYTSIENIHKVIDPLFLDELKAELKEIKSYRQPKAIKEKVAEFQKKLGEMVFLDPACGSGNFLTETYISLRRLENEAIKFSQQDGQIALNTNDIIKVSIGQFYGIEINDFAVTVAQTALWIAELQMLHETEQILHTSLDFLPLKSYKNIVEGNALRIDWETVVPKDRLNYIMGNPPFVGNNNLSNSQRIDVANYFKKNKTVDYVACWYAKAVKYIQNTNIECAFVSTNSITQGEQVPILWKDLILCGNIKIIFAHKTFRWDSEATSMAHVHCVIVGFACNHNNDKKRLYDSNKMYLANNINAYLIDAPDIFVENRKHPICSVPEMRKGNQPTDGGNLIINASEYDDFIKNEPKAKPYIKRLIGATEYINNIKRYCLWLVDCSPNEIRQMPLVMERVKKVREMRLASPDSGTKRLAEKPTIFRETNNPYSFIFIPSHSSENRRYIPIGFLDNNTIATNAALIIPNATLYHFGVLTSNVHMAWMRAVAGRLEMRYRYSKDIVYNNFPWCNPTPEQKARVEQTAQAVLDARAKYPDCSLADLYDDLAMPPELRKAHEQNDKAVMDAYGFGAGLTESECVAELMRMYTELTKEDKG